MNKHIWVSYDSVACATHGHTHRYILQVKMATTKTDPKWRQTLFRMATAIMIMVLLSFGSVTILNLSPFLHFSLTEHSHTRSHGDNILGTLPQNENADTSILQAEVEEAI